MDFRSELTSLSDEVFDQLLGDATITPTDIVGSQAPEEIVRVTPKNKDTSEETNQPSEENKENKEDIIPLNLEQDLEELLEEESTDNKDDKTVNKTPSTQNQNVDMSEFFKGQYQGLVDRGLWDELDEESLKDFEWNEENYGDLIELQAEWRAESKYKDKIESTGDFGKTVFEFIEKGGNPNEVISLFKDLKEYQEIDTTTTDGKIEKLRKYYVDKLGWTESKFKRNTDTWIDNGEIDEEVDFVNSKYKDTIDQEIQEQKRQAELVKRQQEEAQLNFANNIQRTIADRKDISKKEANEILNSLLKYDQTLPDGRKVNEFTVAFMRMQSDLNEYVDFVRYVKNPSKFKETIKDKVESDTNKKNWNLIKGGAALKTNTSTKEISRNTQPQGGFKLDYKSILNNK